MWCYCEECIFCKLLEVHLCIEEGLNAKIILFYIHQNSYLSYHLLNFRYKHHQSIIIGCLLCYDQNLCLLLLHFLFCFVKELTSALLPLCWFNYYYHSIVWENLWQTDLERSLMKLLANYSALEVFLEFHCASISASPLLLLYFRMLQLFYSVCSINLIFLLLLIDLVYPHCILTSLSLHF